MSHAPHSDLEVVHNADTPEAQKYAYNVYDAPESYAHPDADTHKIAYTTDAYEHDRTKTICGLRRRWFWIVALLAITVVAGAVGGGVGGALASKSSNSDNNTSNEGIGAAQSSTSLQSAASSTTPTPTSAEPSTSISRTSIVGPSSTIVRDCPSSNNTLYDVTLGDSKMTFRKACAISYLNANGIDSVVARPMKSLDDCINACATYNINNRTQIASGSNRICNAVCWRNTFDPINDWPGGMCFGYTSQNSSGTFKFRTPAETRCDSAALINQEY